MLAEINVTYTEKVKNKLVLVHPDNRFGVGVVGSDVISHVVQVTKYGWSWPEVENRARAFEIAPGARGKSQIAKT